LIWSEGRRILGPSAPQGSVFLGVLDHPRLPAVVISAGRKWLELSHFECGLQPQEVFSSGQASPFVFNGITFREWIVIVGDHLARDAARQRRLFFRLMSKAPDVMRRQGSGM
jgi:hypothetical protein